MQASSHEASKEANASSTTWSKQSEQSEQNEQSEQLQSKGLHSKHAHSISAAWQAKVSSGPDAESKKLGILDCEGVATLKRNVDATNLKSKETRTRFCSHRVAQFGPEWLGRGYLEGQGVAKVTRASRKVLRQRQESGNICDGPQKGHKRARSARGSSFE